MGSGNVGGKKWMSSSEAKSLICQDRRGGGNWDKRWMGKQLGQGRRASPPCGKATTLPF